MTRQDLVRLHDYTTLVVRRLLRDVRVVMPTLCSVLHIQPHVVLLSRAVWMELVHMWVVYRLVHRQQDTQMSRHLDVCSNLLHTPMPANLLLFGHRKLAWQCSSMRHVLMHGLCS